MNSYDLPSKRTGQNTPITAVIVDDEAPARRLIRSLLEVDPSIVLVAECDDGTEAVAAIHEFRPDLVFIDVEMPTMDGVSVIRQFAGGSDSPYFILVTAYDRFAIEAFELDVVDYLVKPISKERMGAAIARARLGLQRDSAVTLTTRILELASGVGDSAPPRPDEQRLTLRKHDAIRSVRFDDIVWVEAANQYVRIHTEDDMYIMSQSLGKFGARLSDSRFVRVHRSAIVNGHRIRRVSRTKNGSYMIVLDNGVELGLARSRMSLLPMLLRLAEVKCGPGKNPNNLITNALSDAK